ncbi:MAG: hypothetical protein BAA01_13360 [Bacillus thermozeamaize]|uniref:Right handed beta helix domain-containing protein n=1 Tax=Bacillus thermozeamaize TaxID=230954 RepID=A0A1Y3PSE4_9BACI|nr:MAG: hypothetical protein BAA01_13360 [Bacillus thermozeamaize]
MEYHVSVTGDDRARGTADEPFRTISRAASLAVAGDTVIVHAGVYREWVRPAHGGTEEHRIVYKSAGDGEVVITGAERITDWKYEGDNVWSTEVPNTLFSVRNPFEVELAGDWLFDGAFPVHLGDVYLDGKSLYECESVEKVFKPEVWPDAKYPEDSLMKWYAEVGPVTTKIWANFGGKDPREENVEISVRPHCFFPEKPGVDYITVSGFTLRQAAPQWAPPTAFQEGLIGPHWSKGWIIENNVICESKCVGISLGTPIGTGHARVNGKFTKGGTQREQEVIFRALHEGGWHKDRVGGHIVRNNVIHDCEQAGIVGHMGGAFSRIYGNRIYNIHHKRLRHGAEVAGIKLHAALDTQITDNIIYSCYRGLWLDWQAQGTRVSRNVFFDNLSEDLFVEVCHGPYLVDHNLFLSPMNFRNMSQGGAFVHNLFAGRFVVQSELSRTTPYHFPHETAVAGYAKIAGGDDRYYNNVFLGDGGEREPVPITFFEHLPLKPRERKTKDGKPVMDGVPEDSVCWLHPVGLGSYDEHPDVKDKPWWEYTKEEFAQLEDAEKKQIFAGNAALPVAMGGNLYLGGAVPGRHEPGAKTHEQRGVEIERDPSQGKVRVRITEPERIRGASPMVVTTDLLGSTYHAAMKFENPDGTPLRLDADFFGNRRPDADVTPGPFELTGDEAVELVFG